MNVHALEKKSGGWLSYLDGSSDGFGGLLPEYARAGSGSFVHDGVGATYMEHPIFSYPSHNNGLSRSIDLGDLQACPRWRLRRWAPPNPSGEGGG